MWFSPVIGFTAMTLALNRANGPPLKRLTSRRSPQALMLVGTASLVGGPAAPTLGTFGNRASTFVRPVVALVCQTRFMPASTVNSVFGAAGFMITPKGCELR